MKCPYFTFILKWYFYWIKNCELTVFQHFKDFSAIFCLPSFYMQFLWLLSRFCHYLWFSAVCVSYVTFYVFISFGDHCNFWRYKFIFLCIFMPNFLFSPFGTPFTYMFNCLYCPTDPWGFCSLECTILSCSVLIFTKPLNLSLFSCLHIYQLWNIHFVFLIWLVFMLRFIFVASIFSIIS